MKYIGLIKNNKSEAIMHKTLLKIICNPILRKFGYSIVSHIENNKFIKYEIRLYPKYCKVIK